MVNAGGDGMNTIAKDLTMIIRYGNVSIVNFRRIIADELKDRGMTQLALAKKAATTPAKVSDYLAGKKNITDETLARIFKVLGLTVTRVKPARKTKARA
jgi:transcriptional regulator with XRE-family HTH domain